MNFNYINYVSHFFCVQNYLLHNCWKVHHPSSLTHQLLCQIWQPCLHKSVRDWVFSLKMLLIFGNLRTLSYFPVHPLIIITIKTAKAIAATEAPIILSFWFTFHSYDKGIVVMCVYMYVHNSVCVYVIWGPGLPLLFSGSGSYARSGTKPSKFLGILSTLLEPYVPVFYLLRISLIIIIPKDPVI